MCPCISGEHVWIDARLMYCPKCGEVAVEERADGVTTFMLECVAQSLARARAERQSVNRSPGR